MYAIRSYYGEIAGSLVVPTAKLWILYALRENKPTTLYKIPAWFFTSTDIVSFIDFASIRAPFLCLLDITADDVSHLLCVITSYSIHYTKLYD